VVSLICSLFEFLGKLYCSDFRSEGARVSRTLFPLFFDLGCGLFLVTEPLGLCDSCAYDCVGVDVRDGVLRKPLRFFYAEC
jgi:hypothetical protein